jgi:hypothetical protein
VRFMAWILPSVAEPHKCRQRVESSQIVDGLAARFQRVLTCAIRFSTV